MKTPMVISFSSGDEGVGKTTAIKNIALLMAKREKKVLIVDFDCRESEMVKPFRKKGRKNFSQEKEIKEPISAGPAVDFLRVAPRGAENLRLSKQKKMYFLYEMEKIGKNYDVIFINNPIGISNNSLYFCLASQQRIIIISPKPSSISNAYKIIKELAKKHHVRSFSIMINMVKDSREAQKIFRQLTMIADRYIGLLSISYSGFVPKDSSVIESKSTGKNLMDEFSGSHALKGFDEITRNLLSKIEEDYVDGNIKFFNEQLVKT